MNKKKILSLIMALVMLVGVFSPLAAFAEPAPPQVESIIDPANLGKVDENTDNFKTTLLIHKLIREESGEGFGPNFPVDHNGGKVDLNSIENVIGVGATVKEIAGVEFTYYKIPNAQKLEEMKANPEKYDTAKEMDALVATQGSGVTKGGAVETTVDAQGKVQPAKVENLEKGYYWFIETKRPSNITKAIAVPFPLAIPVLLKGDIQGTGTPESPQYKEGEWYLKEVHVYPKNEKEEVEMAKGYILRNGERTNIDSSQLNKTLTAEEEKAWKAKYGADYQKYLDEKEAIDGRKGSVVPYEVPTLLKKGQIYTGASWTDRMTKGLNFVKASDVATVGGSALKLEVKLPAAAGQTAQFVEVTKNITIPDPADSTKTKDIVTYNLTEHDNGFELELTKDYIDYINEQLKSGNVEFKLSYCAFINGETVVDKKENNNITFVPGGPNPGGKITPTNGEIEITKTWSDTNDSRNTKVTYLLEKDGKTVASVTTDGSKLIEENYTGKIKFELGTDKYSGKFTGLDNAEYTIREFVNGYEAKFTPGTNSMAIKNELNPSIITPRPPKVETYNFKFVKTDGNNNRLSGAEFYVTRKGTGNTTEYLTYNPKVVEDNKTAYTTAEKNYNDAINALNEALKKGEISATNKVTILGTEYNTKAAAQAKIDELATIRDNAYAAMKITWSWTTNEADAFVFTSNQQGQIEVEGLAYGTYNLVEKKAPDGFAKLTAPIEFKIGTSQTAYNIPYRIAKLADESAADTTVLTKDADIIGMTYADALKFFDANKDGQLTVKEFKDGVDALEVVNKNVTIPQTGGIGTVIFTVVGVVLMAGAVIAMKKNREEA